MVPSAKPWAAAYAITSGGRTFFENELTIARINPPMNPMSASAGLFARQAKAPTVTSTAKSPAVLMTTSSIDIGADDGRASIVLRSRVPTASPLIRAKPRPLRTGLELRINFSLYMCENELPYDI